MSYADRIVTEPCGCRVDSPTGLIMHRCWFHTLDHLVEAAAWLGQATEFLDPEERDTSIGYPVYLPTFVEFVNDLAAWRDAQREEGTTR